MPKVIYHLWKSGRREQFATLRISDIPPSYRDQVTTHTVFIPQDDYFKRGFNIDTWLRSKGKLS